MVYITGDTHGDFHRFSTSKFPAQKEMSRDDFVIVCGDFGGIWNGGTNEAYWLTWLSEKPFTLLFVDGNHENFDIIEKLPEKEIEKIYNHIESFSKKNNLLT